MTDRVFLIGMACSGKTTIGKILATKLGWNFFDTDEYIQQHHNIDFRKLISSDPAKFHALEFEALTASRMMRPCVVSTGGRTYLNKENKEYINRAGETVFIKVSLWNLLKRFNRGEQNKRALPFWRMPIWIALPVVYWQRVGFYGMDSRVVEGDRDAKTVADDILFLVNK